jgi:hypothetical protein
MNEKMMDQPTAVEMYRVSLAGPIETKFTTHAMGMARPR